MRIAIIALVGAFHVTSVSAQGFAWSKLDNNVGVSRLFNNEFIGDGQDRWRTGSYEVLVTFGEPIIDGLPVARSN